MSGPRLVVLGRRIRPLERIAVAGEILGLTRSTSFRLARADDWPLVGPPTSRWVLMTSLLSRYQVSYSVEHDAACESADPHDDPMGQP